MCRIILLTDPAAPLNDADHGGPFVFYQATVIATILIGGNPSTSRGPGYGSMAARLIFQPISAICIAISLFALHFCGLATATGCITGEDIYSIPMDTSAMSLLLAIRCFFIALKDDQCV